MVFEVLFSGGVVVVVFGLLIGFLLSGSEFRVCDEKQLVAEQSVRVLFCPTRGVFERKLSVCVFELI